MQSLHVRLLRRRAFSLAIQAAGDGMLIADRVVDRSTRGGAFLMASSRKRSECSHQSRQRQSQRDLQRQPREEPKRRNIESSRQGDSERSPSVNQPMPREDRGSESQQEQNERESRRPGGSGDRSMSNER
jgi:hypothetical protein